MGEGDNHPRYSVSLPIQAKWPKEPEHHPARGGSQKHTESVRSTSIAASLPHNRPHKTEFVTFIRHSKNLWELGSVLDIGDTSSTWETPSRMRRFEWARACLAYLGATPGGQCGWSRGEREGGNEGRKAAGPTQMVQGEGVILKTSAHIE